MIVTKYHYPLEKNLIKMFDLMIDRVSKKGAKKDVVLLFEGGEGEGKSTFSIASAIYFAEQTGREFSVKNVFFDIEKMIDFAINTKEQIIIWDEPALQALSTDWASSAVKNLTRLLMMARKKQHIIFINMTKFYKFNEYIVVDRAIALIHVYSRNNIQSGHFQYIRKKYLEKLWRDYRFGKKRSYKKYASKKIRGSFPDIMNIKYANNICSGFNVDDYEKEKDNAIQMIGKDTNSKENKKTYIRQRFLDDLMKQDKEKGVKRTEKEYASIFDCSISSHKRDKNVLMNTPLNSSPSKSPLINNMGKENG